MQAFKWISALLLILIFGASGIYVLMNSSAWGMTSGGTFGVMIVIFIFMAYCLRFLFVDMYDMSFKDVKSAEKK